METIHDFDRLFTTKLHGYQSPEHYYEQAGAIHRIPGIRNPTLFMCAVDDPILGGGGIDYEVF